MAWSNIGGGGENVSAEVARQKQLIEEMESLYKGKTTGADATADDILEDKRAYVGRKLIIGTHPDVTAEVEEQTPLIQQIREAIVGKATLANATADKIVKGYSAYVGQELVNGTLEPLTGIDFGTVTVDSQTTLTIEHSLGVIPKEIFLLRTKQYDKSAIYGVFMLENQLSTSTSWFGNYIYGSTSNVYIYGLASSKIVKTENSVTFNTIRSGYPYIDTYEWVFIA